MGKTRIAWAIAGSLLACAAMAQTSVYRWVDKDGKVHFSSEPPPADATNVTEKRMGGGNTAEGQLPYATQMAMKSNPVTLYVSNSCGEYCVEARQLLASRGIPFTEKNAEASPEETEKLRALVGALQVPVLVVGKTPLKGFAENTWQSALDSAGYPRTKLPGQLGPRPPESTAQPAPPAQDANAPK
jgi:glutaredoxin